MFTEAPFTIAKMWKLPKCPSTDEWIKKMWYTYTMEYSSSIRKNEIMPFTATRMDLGSVIVSEVSVQFSSVAQACPTLCDPMDCSTPGLPVHHQLPEFTQSHVH